MDESFLPRAKRGILVTLLVYALLVATHMGEFWPFSIFPMFSQAGNPWTRALIRQLPEEETSEDLWRTVSLDELPGKPLPVDEQGVNQNDVANFVSKTQSWNAQRLRGLRRLLEPPQMDGALLVYKVRGRLDENAVVTTAEPLILFATDTTFTAPSISLDPTSHP